MESWISERIRIRFWETDHLLHYIILLLEKEIEKLKSKGRGWWKVSQNFTPKRAASVSLLCVVLFFSAIDISTWLMQTSKKTC